MPLEPNYYAIISRAVEEGVDSGYRRAYKHNDSPEEDTIKDEIHSAVINALTEVLQFAPKEVA